MAKTRRNDAHPAHVRLHGRGMLFLSKNRDLTDEVSIDTLTA